MSTLPAQNRSESERLQRIERIRDEAALQAAQEHRANAFRPELPAANATDGYYQTPLLKKPQWKWEVPVYFFVGGAAGAAALIGLMANRIGKDPALARDARWLAAAGGALSPMLLTADLGVPRRFLNMLRVFKLQSPMSVGAWTMVGFSSATGAAAFAGLLRERFSENSALQVVENAGEWMSAATGLLFNSYTGVLIGATVVPVWNKNVGSLPIHFGASGAAAAVSMLELAGHEKSKALNLIGIGASLVETVEGLLIEAEHSEVNRPLKRGASGWMTRLGGLLSGPVPLALRVGAMLAGGERNSQLRRGAAIASLAGSMLTRIGWVQAGSASTRDYRLPLRDAEPSAKLSPADPILQKKSSESLRRTEPKDLRNAT